MSGFIQGKDPRRTAKPWKPGGLPSPSQNVSTTGAAAPGASGPAPGYMPPPPRLAQQIVLYPPRERPIPGANLFNYQGQQASAIVQPNIFIPGADFTLPKATIGRIDSIVFEVQDLLPTSALTFSLTFNQRPVPGFTNIAIFPGNAAIFYDTYEVLLDVPKNTRIQIRFSNGDGGTYLLGGSFSGWYWTEADGIAYMASGTVT